jgi:YbbR domain-containing protein
VPRVTATPNLVHIVVPVEQWPGRKEVAVRVNLVDQPAAGYRLSSVRVNPSTVVLLGSAEVLTEVPGFVETEPVSLANATAEIQRRVQVIVPQGVTVLEGTAVDVTVSIAAIEGGTTVKQHPVVQGLGPGLEATVALDTVDVILSGPLPSLEALGPDDVFVLVDLTGLLPGNHIVTPRVVVPTGIQAAGIIPETIEVVITAVNTPTAEPSTVLTNTVITGTGTPLPSGESGATPGASESVPGVASPLSTPAITPTPQPTAASVPGRTPTLAP